MKTGFTFKGRHTSEFGIVARTKSRAILPPMKKYTYDMPLYDGELDFSAANAYGREFYGNRSFSVTLTVICDDIYALQRKLSKIAAWLNGRGELIFDDMPWVKWRAVVSDSIGTLPEINGRKAKLDVEFDAEPFSVWVKSVNEGLMLSDKAELGFCVPIGLPEMFEYDLEAASGEFLAGELTFVNMGDRPARPKITVTGNNPSLNTLTVTAGDEMMYFFVNVHKIVIDCEKRTAVNENGESVLSSTSDSFFEFSPGATKMTFKTGVKGAKISVKIEYEPKYLYDYDYDIDWGEE